MVYHSSNILFIMLFKCFAETEKNRLQNIRNRRILVVRNSHNRETGTRK